MAATDISPRPIRELDGPTTLPFLGNMHQIRFERMHQQFDTWADRFGQIYLVHFGPHPVVVLSETETIRKVLNQRPNAFRRSRSLQNVTREMGLLGVFTAEGDDWRRQRRIVISALNRSRLKPFFPNMQVLANRLLARWQGAADRGETVDVCRDLMRFTVDVTAWLAFGTDFNTLETDGPVIQQNLDKVFPKLHHRSSSPLRYWRYIRLPSDRVLDRALAQVKVQAGEMIREARERIDANPALREEPENFLEALLVAAENDESSEGGFTDGEVFANIGTLLLAGEDTTANSMGWMIDDFIRNPGLYERARAEADAVIGPGQVAQDIEATEKLSFIDAFCNESMRMRPVVPLNFVETLRDTEILGYLIPEGTGIFLLSQRIARFDDNFGDAARFDPDRWLMKPAQRNFPHNSHGFIPFGAGPRLCPGRGLAMLQIRTVISMLCRNFDIEPVVADQKVKEKLAFTMVPVGLGVRFRHRQS